MHLLYQTNKAYTAYVTASRPIKIQLTPALKFLLRDLVKFVVTVKCCYSHYIIIKEKDPWGTNKNVVRDGFLL